MGVVHFNNHDGFLVRQDVHIGRSSAEEVATRCFRFQSSKSAVHDHGNVAVWPDARTGFLALSNAVK